MVTSNPADQRDAHEPANLATDTPEPKTASRASVLRRILNLSLSMTIAVIFVGLMGAGIAALHLRAAAENLPQPPAPTPVETIRLQMRDGYKEINRFVGRLEPARQTSLAFERAGLVVEIVKDEGDGVRAGETIARLDTAQLQASRRQLEARVRELEARRDLANLTLGRQSKLKTRGWSPEQRLDEAEASVSELTAAIERVSAQIASVDIDLEKSAIAAPFDGIVSARSIDEGTVVAPGTAILTLLEAGRRQARIGLPPDVAANLDKTSTYSIEAGNGKAAARLVTRRPDLQPGTRTVAALFEIVGEASVPFGEIVTLAIAREIPSKGAWVPMAALKEGHRGLWNIMTVQERDGEKIVRGEAVEVLHVAGERAYVRGTFPSGAEIISKGTNRVVTGQQVARAGE